MPPYQIDIYLSCLWTVSCSASTSITIHIYYLASLVTSSLGVPISVHIGILKSITWYKDTFKSCSDSISIEWNQAWTPPSPSRMHSCLRALEALDQLHTLRNVRCLLAALLRGEEKVKRIWGTCKIRCAMMLAMTAIRVTNCLPSTHHSLWRQI